MYKHGKTTVIENKQDLMSIDDSNSILIFVDIEAASEYLKQNIEVMEYIFGYLEFNNMATSEQNIRSLL